MTVGGFVVLLLVAAVVGSIGQSLAGYSAGGCFFSIVVGFIGAALGLWLAGQLHLPEILMLNIDGKPFPVVWAIAGSALFAGILGLMFRRRLFA